MNPREKLYYLLKKYGERSYDTSTFCEQFTSIYYLELDDEQLLEEEKRLLAALAVMTSRYSSDQKRIYCCQMSITMNVKCGRRLKRYGVS